MDLTTPSVELLLLTMSLLLAAGLYSTSGHGGATAYLALFGLFGVVPASMRPMALVLNVVVAGFGSLRLWRAGVMPWRTLGFLVLGSVPGTMLGGLIDLPATTYRGLLGAALLVAATSLILPQHTPSDPGEPTRCVPPAALLVVGLLLGVLSGLTGIGGGIFLSPLLILLRIEDPRRTAAAAAAFIVVNSLTGLTTLAWRGGLTTLPPVTAAFAVVVLLGGMVGSWLAAGRLTLRGLRVALGIVLVVSGTKLLGEALTTPTTTPTTAP